MIFVSLGSREYQFNRLLKELDRLVEAGQIQEEVFAQVGGSDYEPKHYQWERFLDRERFTAMQQQADLIISHGGTGALIGALKLGKKVIAVPRLARFGEHIDDHQTQISGVLAEQGYLLSVTEMDSLGEAVEQMQSTDRPVPYQRESHIMPLIVSFLAEL